jgi:anthranilate synthase / indole-3-glycerol phosphate synthase / phosphoribosylanthranilate isomerase
MAVRLRQYVLEADQYHPESVISEHGLALFLEYDCGTWPTTTTTSPPLSSLLENIHNHKIKDIATAKIAPGSSTTDLLTLPSLNLSPPLIPALAYFHFKATTSALCRNKTRIAFERPDRTSPKN